MADGLEVDIVIFLSTNEFINKSESDGIEMRKSDEKFEWQKCANLKIHWKYVDN